MGGKQCFDVSEYMLSVTLSTSTKLKYYQSADGRAA